MSNVLADLSSNQVEPGTGEDLAGAASRRNAQKRAHRSRQVGRLVRNLFVVVFAILGIGAGYYVWDTYIASDAASTAVDDLNQQLNELSGGTIAEDVDLSQYVAEEQTPSEPMMLTQIEGTAIVLELEEGVTAERSWRTILERSLADGTWEGIDRFQSRFNPNQKSVWSVDMIGGNSTTLYRWVVIDDQAAAETRQPVAVSDPFILPAEGDEHLIVIAKSVTP